MFKHKKINYVVIVSLALVAGVSLVNLVIHDFGNTQTNSAAAALPSISSAAAVIGTMHHHSNAQDGKQGAADCPPNPVSIRKTTNTLQLFDIGANTPCAISSIRLLTNEVVKVNPAGPILTGPGTFNLTSYNYNDKGDGVIVLQKYLNTRQGAVKSCDPGMVNVTLSFGKPRRDGSQSANATVDAGKFSSTTQAFANQDAYNEAVRLAKAKLNCYYVVDACRYTPNVCRAISISPSTCVAENSDSKSGGYFSKISIEDAYNKCLPDAKQIPICMEYIRAAKRACPGYIPN